MLNARDDPRDADLWIPLTEAERVVLRNYRLGIVQPYGQMANTIMLLLLRERFARTTAPPEDA